MGDASTDTLVVSGFSLWGVGGVDLCGDRGGVGGNLCGDSGGVGHNFGDIGGVASLLLRGDSGQRATGSDGAVLAVEGGVTVTTDVVVVVIVVEAAVLVVVVEIVCPVVLLGKTFGFVSLADFSDTLTCEFARLVGFCVDTGIFTLFCAAGIDCGTAAADDGDAACGDGCGAAGVGSGAGDGIGFGICTGGGARDMAGVVDAVVVGIGAGADVGVGFGCL